MIKLISRSDVRLLFSRGAHVSDCVSVDCGHPSDTDQQACSLFFASKFMSFLLIVLVLLVSKAPFPQCLLYYSNVWRTQWEKELNYGLCLCGSCFTLFIVTCENVRLLCYNSGQMSYPSATFQDICPIGVKLQWHPWGYTKHKATWPGICRNERKTVQSGVIA